MNAPTRELADAVAALVDGDASRVSALASQLNERIVESTVSGLSMRDTLPPGSRIRIQLARRRRYTPGEVVAFLAGRQLTVHRVIHQVRSGPAAGFLLTRGDAPIVPDAPVHPARVLGPVIAIRRDDEWQTVGARSARPLRGRVLAAGIAVAATGLLYLSPRLAGAAMGLLHRLEGTLRHAREQGVSRGPSSPDAR